METGCTLLEVKDSMVGGFRLGKNDRAYGFVTFIVAFLVLSSICVAETFPTGVDVLERKGPVAFNGAKVVVPFPFTFHPNNVENVGGTDRRRYPNTSHTSLKIESVLGDQRNKFELQKGSGQDQHQNVLDKHVMEIAKHDDAEREDVVRYYSVKSRGIKGRFSKTENCTTPISCKTWGSRLRGRAASSVFKVESVLNAKKISLSNPEAQILLSWRASLTDGPSRPLASWDFSVQSNACRWQGVGCDESQQHVVSISLAGRRIAGSISSGLSRLPFLTSLDLSYNRLSQGIPDDLANIATLQSLNLSFNALTGIIPAFGNMSSSLISLNLMKNRLRGSIPQSLGECKQLVQLNLARNNLRGGVPIELGMLRNLQVLYLYQNKLSGDLPSSLGSIEGLVTINLGYNLLTGGIPDDYSKLSALQGLYLQVNNLTGNFPQWLADVTNLSYLNLSNNGFMGPIPQGLGSSKMLVYLNLSNNSLLGRIPTSLVDSLNLTEIDLSANELSGPIPVGLGYRSMLQELRLGQNSLTGSISPFLTTASNLSVLDLSSNNLSGPIPRDIGQLTNLASLDLSGNLLGDILPDLGSLTNLMFLNLSNNRFTGQIPASLGNLVQLQLLSLGNNQFVGNIPQLSSLINLTTLTLNDNMLNGTIPDTLGQFRSLRVLHLQGNMLSGPVPTSFNTLGTLQDFVISDNQLTGELSGPFVSSLSHLQTTFSVANNRMSGPLPKELGLLTMVQTLDLSKNSFVSKIPDEIGNCRSLLRLDLSDNNLTNVIPNSIGSLSSLQVLNVSHNSLTGSIPVTVGALAELRLLDLIANNLTGGIPSSLVGLRKLSFLNLSENELEGPVPEGGSFGNFSASSYLPGNSKLCGPPLLISCIPALVIAGDSKRSLSTGAWIGVGCGAAAFVALIIASVCLCWRYIPCGKAPEKRGSIIARSELFYPQLRFTVQDLKYATEDFSSVNILGSGSLSTVYRGVLPELVLVSVKKLKIANGTQIPPGFIEELDELEKLRHRHLVSILGHCFDMDVNAIVVQFMSNGSLEEHLHKRPTCDLDWPARAKVAIGVAKAVHFLHHECGSPIVHCDVKPSNVLLDAEYEAHLEDFGLSRLIFVNKLMDMTNSSVGSSIGYFPPEYGFSPLVSVKGDVYSFGILLLELLTGKKPTSDMFKEDLSLTKWCESAFPNNIMDVLDPSLIRLEGTDVKQVTLFMKVALMCAQSFPDDRPTMTMVLEMLR